MDMIVVNFQNIKKSLCILVALLVIHQSARTQIIQMTEFDNFELNFNSSTPQDYHGSPYLDEEWHVVELTLRGKKKRYLKARYNIHERFLELIMNTEHKYIKADYISSFVIVDLPSDTNTIYHPNIPINNQNESLEGFVQKTDVGPYSVASSYKTTLRKASKENPHLSTTKDHKGQMIILKKHYIYKDAQYHQIKKEKDLYKLFETEEKKLKNKIKKDNIDIKSHDGLIAILTHIIEE